ncbi:MAG TPA: AAA family ATPase [Myxococcales bacterium]|nr:AAA family ATPase [Myxococcales bacterium]
MNAIRSILWIGPYDGLVQNGIMQANHLDVVWVADVDSALELPVASFEAAVIALDKADRQRDAMTRCSGNQGMPPLVILASQQDAEPLRRHLPIGGGEVIVAETLSDGPPFIAELHNRIETVIAERTAMSQALRSETRRTAPKASNTATKPRSRSRSRSTKNQTTAQATTQTTTQTTAMTNATSGREHVAAVHLAGSAIIGRSEAIRAAYELAERAAEGITTVLLHGETGTGKELFAQAIHGMSDRAGHPFVAINCAAIPDSLLESELFGHVRGAFTGATGNKTGLFETARGGTLFLDEIGETSISLQAKLLRAIQEREIRPVGGSGNQKIDVRIVAASNRDLRVEATQGTFREDLYYRLAVFPISIPPLRKRGGDILLIAQHFLRKYGKSTNERVSTPPFNKLSQSAADLLLTYSWPGNVRELENEIQRATMLSGKGKIITPEDLSDSICTPSPHISNEEHIGKTLRETVAQVESQIIRRTLAKNGGRRARSARELGITREGLYKKMKRLGVD